MNTAFFTKSSQAISDRCASGARRFTQFETWTYGLLNAVVIGGSTSVSSWLGFAAAHSVGIDVPILNFKGVGIMFLAGAGVKFFAYLAQGLPNLTQTFESASTETGIDGSTVSKTSKTVITTPVETLPDPPKVG